MFLLGGGLLGSLSCRSKRGGGALAIPPALCRHGAGQRGDVSGFSVHRVAGRAPHNPWVQAFEWIRRNTPENAYFAMDPNTMQTAG